MAIDVRELRIGNLVNYYDSEIRLDGVTTAYVTGQSPPDVIDPSNISGIPLSSSILERAGFSKVENEFTIFDNIKGPYYALDALLLWSNGSEPKDAYLVYYADQMFGKYQAVYSRWINSLHELQNVYHAWKGKDLEIR